MRTLPGNIAIFVPHSGCPQQCSFCNQRAISGQNIPPTGFQAAALCAQALETLLPTKGRVEIAFFGGSFTAIDQHCMVELLEAVQPFLTNERVAGIRVSTRPDAIDRERLALLQRYGVTAIELGAQSMDDQVLERNLRGHTAADVAAACTLIREYGFSLGLQMMTGLYGADAHSDYATALALADLEPDAVRIYPTVVLEGTLLAKKLRIGEYLPPGVEETVPLCARIVDLLESRGIPILRLGLHSSETMEREILGGCYHPALGELVAGERYYNRIVETAQTLGTRHLTLHIPPRLLSQVRGHQKRTVARLAKNGYNIEYRIDDSVADLVTERNDVQFEATGNRTTGL